MPYSIGLQAAAAAFLSAGFVAQFTLAVITLLAIFLFTPTLQRDAADLPTRLPCYSALAIIPFFRQRYDFLNWAFHATGETVFRFQLLRVCNTIYLEPSVKV